MLHQKPERPQHPADMCRAAGVNIRNFQLSLSALTRHTSNPALTGAAARQAAGPAADRFRQLTEQRVHAAVVSSGASRDAALHTSWGITMPINASSGLKAQQSVVAGAQPTNGGDFVYAPTAL